MAISRRKYLLAAAAFSVAAPLPVSVSAGEVLTVTDLAGRTVSFEKRPQRFVVANYIANFLFVGGSQAVASIVGLTGDGWQSTRYAEYVRLTEAFPKLKSIPSVGGYHDDILNTEKILALRPDVVLVGLTQYAQNASRLDLLSRAGIRVVVLDYHAMTVENHARSTEILGQLLGREDIAARQIKRYRDVVDLLSDRIGKLPKESFNQKIYVECGNQGVAAYGNSYNSTVLWGGILERLRANNIAGQMQTPYASLSREFVLSQNPDIIFIAGSIWQNSAENDQMRMGLMVSREEALQRLDGFMKRSLWDRLKAVQNQRVYGVDHGSLRSMMDYAFSIFMAQMIYPDVFNDLNAEAEIQAFYKEYLPEVNASGTFVLNPRG